MVRLKAVKRRTKINYFSIAWQIKNNYFNRKNLTMCNHIKTPRLRQLYINFWFSVCQRTCFVICERIADCKNRILQCSTEIYKNLSIELRSFPTISLSSLLSCRLLNKIKLSSSNFISVLASSTNSFNYTSVISPSNTEFCIQFKYRRQSFNILPTCVSFIAYTSITYIIEYKNWKI